MPDSIDQQLLKFLITTEPLNNPNLEKAIQFYEKHILEVDRDLKPLLDEYNFKNQFPEWKYELLAAILVGDKSRKGTIEKYFDKNPSPGKRKKKGGRGNSKNGNGADLLWHEVKSRGKGQGFEYQYHKNSWQTNLEEALMIKHIYISYWNDNKDVDVMIVKGEKLKDFFEKIKEDIENIYNRKNFEARCRPAVSYKTVVDRASLILSIRDGKVAYSNMKLLEANDDSN